MVWLEGGRFLMGAAGPETWPADREGPVRPVEITPFWIDESAVTNRAFAAFVEATAFVTETERFEWSFVHHSQLPKSQRKKFAARRVAGLEWWYSIPGTHWRTPLGGADDIAQLDRLDHPVVHVTWNDAAAFAAWSGKRLPTEAEWEFAARGGLEQQLYPWGNDLHPGGKHRCNIWQGEFPKTDTGDDGYRGTAPARSFKPNGYGLFNLTGNTWEWTADHFHTPPHEDRRAMRGGSYLCHVSYCNRYRCAARTSNTPDSSAGHLGFRCAADPVGAPQG
jgi:formylglycine-generating enzyme required for sulfatase activity